MVEIYQRIYLKLCFLKIERRVKSMSRVGIPTFGPGGCLLNYLLSNSKLTSPTRMLTGRFHSVFYGEQNSTAIENVAHLMRACA